MVTETTETETGAGALSKAKTRKASLRMAFAWLLMPLFFLVTGGSIAWWEAWVYCLLVLVPMTLFVARMVRVDPEFLERRFTMKEKEQTQRRVVSWGSGLILALYVLPGLDRRFGWSAEPPLVVVVGAQVLALASYLAILKVFAANRWAGRTVETRPGQHVVSTGPYGLVRHPMYAASIVLSLASAVALGSLWAIIPALLTVPMYVVRILNEEEVLLRELPGYEAYREKVRSRLVPHVW